MRRQESARRRTTARSGSGAARAGSPRPWLLAAGTDQLTGAFRPSALPTVLFHSAAHSAPQRLAQPASTAPSTSFLCCSASAGFTGTIVILASLPIVHGCLPVLQLSASPAAFFSVSHILFS